MGKSCRVVTQPTNDQYVTYSAWVCDVVEVFDGSINGETYEELSPRNFKLTTIWTEGAVPLSANSEFEMPSTFIFDENQYVYKFN